MKRTVTPPLLLWLILIFVQVPAHSEEKQRSEMPRPQSALTKAITQVSPSVVQIIVEFSHYPERTRQALEELTRKGEFGQRIFGPIADFVLGTGFLANEDGYVITAKHVMDATRSFSIGDLDLGQRRAIVRIQMPNVGEIGLNGAAAPPGPVTRGVFWAAVFDEVDEDPIHDLALLKIKANPFATDISYLAIKTHVTAAKFSVARPHEGEPIAVSGYPLRSPVLVTTSGAIASSWEVKDSTDVLRDPHLGPLSDSYLADMHVNPGNSGGPVFSISDGSVIGVCVSFDPDLVRYADSKTGELAKSNDHYLSYNSGLSFVVPARYVVELLRKNHLKWTETTPSP